jgi:hypothetical protein
VTEASESESASEISSRMWRDGEIMPERLLQKWLRSKILGRTDRIVTEAQSATGTARYWNYVLRNKLARPGKIYIPCTSLFLPRRFLQALYATEFQTLSKSSACLEAKLRVEMPELRDSKGSARPKRKTFHPDMTHPQGGVAKWCSQSAGSF